MCALESYSSLYRTQCTRYMSCLLLKTTRLQIMMFFFDYLLCGLHIGECNLLCVWCKNCAFIVYQDAREAIYINGWQAPPHFVSNFSYTALFVHNICLFYLGRTRFLYEYRRCGGISRIYAIRIPAK